jgi:hypothetical protein
MNATYHRHISHPHISHPNNVCWVIKTVKLLISNLLLYPVVSVVYFNIPFTIHIPVICCFLGMRNIISYSYSSVGLIICILIITYLYQIGTQNTLKWMESKRLIPFISFSPQNVIILPTKKRLSLYRQYTTDIMTAKVIVIINNNKTWIYKNKNK